MARTVVKPIPFSLPFVHKSALPKTAVDDSPGSSLLGLTTTVGAKLISNAASGNTKTDVCGFMIEIPENWVPNSKIGIRARCKQATTLLTVGTTVDVTLKLQGDDEVGSDLITTSAKTLTISLANYDFFTNAASSVRRGDHLWGTLTLALNDSGGTVNTAAWCTRLWAILAVES